MKPLDIVKIPTGAWAMITETNDCGEQASIDYLDPDDERNEHSAWWNKEDLLVITSIPLLLASAMAHPMGSGEKDAVRAFPLKEKTADELAEETALLKQYPDGFECYMCSDELREVAPIMRDGHTLCSECVDEFDATVEDVEGSSSAD